MSKIMKNYQRALSALLAVLGIPVFGGFLSGCNGETKIDAKTEAEMRDNYKGAPDPSKAPPEQRAKIEAIMKANGAGPSRPKAGAPAP